jgi:succinate-semialdehyde dehydrogenase/glutarate-semialdehyde dehydrogenase
LKFQSVNPIDGTLISEYQEMDEGEVTRAIQEAHTAYTTWQDTSFTIRALHMNKLAEALETKKSDLAALITN